MKPGIRTHVIFWFILGFFLTGVILLLKSMLLPFVLGMAVAYLLDPAVERLGRAGLSRFAATLGILGGFLIFILSFCLALLPVLYQEILQFAHDLPSYAQYIWSVAQRGTDMLREQVGIDAKTVDIENFVKQNGGYAANIATMIVQNLARGGQAIFDIISVLLLMPVVAFFLMIEWPKIKIWAQGMIPRHSQGTVLSLWADIDTKLSGFVRGQLSVTAILGAGYALALSIVGLKYGFMIGLGAGVLSIIPMFGSALGLIIGLAVAWAQSGDISFAGLVAGIFIFGQVVETNFLTPRLVGESVGMHPLWVFFALMAGANLLGILGMLLAVPVAAVIGVLLNFAILIYKESAYYDAAPTVEKPQKARTEKPAKA